MIHDDPSAAWLIDRLIDRMIDDCVTARLSLSADELGADTNRSFRTAVFHPPVGLWVTVQLHYHDSSRFKLTIPAHASTFISVSAHECTIQTQHSRPRHHPIPCKPHTEKWTRACPFAMIPFERLVDRLQFRFGQGRNCSPPPGAPAGAAEFQRRFGSVK